MGAIKKEQINSRTTKFTVPKAGKTAHELQEEEKRQGGGKKEGGK